MSNWLATYKRDGVAIIPRVFTQAEINELRKDALMSVWEHKPMEIVDEFPTILYSPIVNSQMSSKALPYVSKVLKQDYGCVTDQYYFHLPGDPDSFNWHTDSRFREGIDKDAYLQTGIIVDDWTDDNGAVEYIKGSHLKDFKNDRELRGFVRGNLKGEKIYPKSGDLAVWSAFVVHGSQPNRSQYSRQYYMQGFQYVNSSNSFV